jgi:hypothetical protein
VRAYDWSAAQAAPDGLSPREVCAMLDVSRRTLRTYTRRVLPDKRPGRRGGGQAYRYTEAEAVRLKAYQATGALPTGDALARHLAAARARRDRLREVKELAVRLWKVAGSPGPVADSLSRAGFAFTEQAVRALRPPPRPRSPLPSRIPAGLEHSAVNALKTALLQRGEMP